MKCSLFHLCCPGPGLGVLFVSLHSVLQRIWKEILFFLAIFWCHGNNFQKWETKDHSYKYEFLKSQGWFCHSYYNLFPQRSKTNIGFLFGDVMVKGYSCGLSKILVIHRLLTLHQGYLNGCVQHSPGQRVSVCWVCEGKGIELGLGNIYTF